MITILTVALVALFSVSSPSTAQEAEPKQKTAEEQQEEEKPPRVYWDNGLWFRARRANFRLKIGGQAQNDTAAFASGGSQPVELDGAWSGGVCVRMRWGRSLSTGPSSSSGTSSLPDVVRS